MGICAAKQSIEFPLEWKLSPYNFYVLPNSTRSLYSVDTKTLQWLRKNKFDFNRWVDEGYDLIRLDELQALNLKSAYSYLEIGHSGLQCLIEAIINMEKPIVFHNGHLDILHLYDKFLGEIPTPLNLFCEEWIRLFTGGVYDTRYIASEGRYTILGVSDHKYLSLNMLREFLWRKEHKSNFTISSEHLNVIYPLKPEEYAQDSFYHEAGFDALCTAQVFIFELEHFIHSTTINLSKRRRKQMKIIPPTLQPAPWIYAKVPSKFKNFISIAHISPGSFNLDACAKYG